MGGGSVNRSLGKSRLGHNISICEVLRLPPEPPLPWDCNETLQCVININLSLSSVLMCSSSSELGLEKRGRIVLACGGFVSTKHYLEL